MESVIKLPARVNPSGRTNPATAGGGQTQPQAAQVAPVTFRRFTTTDNSPVDTIIATLPNVGDAVQIPVLLATGRTRDGANLIQLGFVGGAINRAGVGGFVITNLGNSQNFGSPGSIVLAPLGDDIILRATGVAGVVFDWTVTWSVLDVAGGAAPT
ncbi:MAG: hypothetical protein K0U11_06755 [Gammaproteobacteria bacterium]|nr:hypothetical protein [Gammaproteobacteria bacterium]